MATYYMTRKEFHSLSTFSLRVKAQAFRTLYCGPLTTDPQLKIYIRGEWPEEYRGDGLFLSGPAAEIVDIGKKFVTVKYRQGFEDRTIKLSLCPDSTSGFSEIVFMTSY